MALTQKADCASSLYFSQDKNKNEMNDSSVSVTPGSWLHVTNFQKNLYRFHFRKQKTYTAQNSSLSLLELRLHTQWIPRQPTHTVGELRLNGPNLPRAFLFPIAHVVELCNELLAESKVIKHSVMYSTLDPGVCSAMLRAQWRPEQCPRVVRKQNTKQGEVFPWGNTDLKIKFIKSKQISIRHWPHVNKIKHLICWTCSRTNVSVFLAPSCTLQVSLFV